MYLKMFILMSAVAFTLTATAQTSNNVDFISNTVSNYKVDEVSAPFFSKAKVWIIFGGAPDNFILREVHWTNDQKSAFSLLLLDDDDTRWLELYSDTLQRSIVKLPDDKSKTMGANGISFITSLLQLFADTQQHTLSGQVTLGDDTFGAAAKELVAPNDSTRLFKVFTFDSTGIGIDGQVLVGRKNGMVVYREVQVFVNKSGVKLKLSLLE